MRKKRLNKDEMFMEQARVYARRSACLQFQVGVKDGMLVVSCKDLHVYGHTFDVALNFVNKGGIWKS